MATRSSRKRAAPGSSPIADATQGDYNVQTDPNYNIWSQKPGDSSTFIDPTDPFAASVYSALANQNLNANTSQSNQLARRNVSNVIPGNPFLNNDSRAGIMNDISQTGDLNWFQQSSDEDKIDAEAREAMEAAKKSRKSIPPFVMKLRSFLDEDKNTDLIRWSTVGDSFIVLDEEEFGRTLIPERFKHANYASFVRQLNMYGFHKQVGLSDNSMRASERKNKSPSEYKNPYFRKGKPEWMWLIQKPKAIPSKSKGGRVRSEDANEDDEGVDGEVFASNSNFYDDKNNGRNPRAPLLISQGAGPGNDANANAGALAKEELAEVHREIKVIRQQNLAIANIIAKMKQDQDLITAQAKAFQEQHSRHENSINAILTFLATVYNRSLENHQGQDIGAMFAGAMPQNFQQHGSVVDVGNLREQDLRAMPNMTGNIKRQPLLLKAAPETNITGNLASSQARGVNTSQAANPRRMPSSAHSNPVNAQPTNGGFILPEEGDVLSWINAANSNDAATPTGHMDFGEALSHLQSRNGKGPLSASERNGMLEMMSNGGGSNMATPRPTETSNAVATPNATTPILDPQKMASISDDMETVTRTLQNSQQSLDNIISRLSPMSPGGPDFSGNEYVPPPEAGLDFDSMFNNDDYFGSNADFATDFGDNNFSFDDALGTGEDQFDGGNDNIGGRIESLHGSEATTPAKTIEEDEPEELKSPRKRRRKS